jgi:hypothetical protein
MRRDYYTLSARNVDWVADNGDPEQPAVTIDFAGPFDALKERLSRPDGDFLAAEETDVSFRLQDADSETGVVSVTNRTNGEFILELNQAADDVLRFIRAARRYGEETGDDATYVVELRRDGDPIVSYEKDTFLVYDSEGDLLRGDSLIPSGIEL